MAVDYNAYVEAQTCKYKSFESKSRRWRNGQSRYVKRAMKKLDRSAYILDIACGDGVGLAVMKKMGFRSLKGIDLCADKVQIAQQRGFDVQLGDMHDLSILENETFDIVYTSHSLEHCYAPKLALQELRRVLKPGGLLLVVVPFPDAGPDEAHCGKYELGTHEDDKGERVMQVLRDCGFQVESAEYDSWREPEIWLSATRTLETCP